MGCPLCTPWGLILVISGMAAVVLSSFLPFLIYIGIGLVVAAYIVPFLITRPKDEEQNQNCGPYCEQNVNNK